MPKTKVSCPNCRQPVIADITQLFDVGADPSAKQRLLSGAFNLIQCPSCGYQGNLASPLVYHDPEKELLLTFSPPELGLPRNEQERMLGGLINQVFSSLPQEKRKGYLFNPQSTLTLQGLIERILEADGITKEMLQAQQQKINLIRRIATVTDEGVLQEIIKEEDKNIDAEFFSILGHLAESAAMQGDRQSALALSELQRKLLPLTTYGREVQKQSEEVQSAIQELQALGKDLSQEKLLDLIVKAPNEIRLSVYVSIARQAMDYTFFQLLSQRIDSAAAEEKEKLTGLRTLLLEMTQEIDRQVAERAKQTRQAIEQIVSAPDMEQILAQNISLIDDLFMQEVERMLADARTQGDLAKSAKLNQIIDIVQKLSAAPGADLMENYLDAPNDAARQKFLQDNQDKIDQGFLDMMTQLVTQVESTGDANLINNVKAANRQLIRFAMKRNM